MKIKTYDILDGHGFPSKMRVVTLDEDEKLSLGGIYRFETVYPGSPPDGYTWNIGGENINCFTFQDIRGAVGMDNMFSYMMTTGLGVIGDVAGCGIYLQRVGNPYPDNDLFIGVAGTGYCNDISNPPTLWNMFWAIPNSAVPEGTDAWVEVYRTSAHETIIGPRVMAMSHNFVDAVNLWRVCGGYQGCYGNGQCYRLNTTIPEWQQWIDNYDMIFYMLKLGEHPVEPVLIKAYVYPGSGGPGGCTDPGGEDGPFRRGQRMQFYAELSGIQIGDVLTCEWYDATVGTVEDTDDVVSTDEGDVCFWTHTRPDASHTYLCKVYVNGNWVGETYFWDVAGTCEDGPADQNECETAGCWWKNGVCVTNSKGIFQGNSQWFEGPFDSEEISAYIARINAYHSGVCEGGGGYDTAVITAKLYYKNQSQQWMPYATYFFPLAMDENEWDDIYMDISSIIDQLLQTGVDNVGMTIFGECEDEPSL